MLLLQRADLLKRGIIALPFAQPGEPTLKELCIEFTDVGVLRGRHRRNRQDGKPEPQLLRSPDSFRVEIETRPTRALKYLVPDIGNHKLESERLVF